MKDIGDFRLSKKEAEQYEKCVIGLQCLKKLQKRFYILENDRDKANRQLEQQLILSNDSELRMINHKLAQCRIDYIKQFENIKFIYKI